MVRHGEFFAPNPEFNGVISYYLRDGAAGQAEITVADAAGKTMRKLKGPAAKGVNRVVSVFGRAAGGAGAGRKNSTKSPRAARTEVRTTRLHHWRPAFSVSSRSSGGVGHRDLGLTGSAVACSTRSPRSSRDWARTRPLDPALAA